MDYQQLMNVADFNKAEAKSEAGIKRFNSNLPPPKKNAKSGVMPDGVRRFLEKKKAEEENKIKKAREEREKLLAIRAQSTKNNKKAKIMASRTKDNDFSKIRLTEDEKESKKKIEQELSKKRLADTVERMKARIELEEKEKLLPKKRKRKVKKGAIAQFEEEMDYHRSNDNDRENVKKVVHKQPRPPSKSYSDLLKEAEKKQFEPIVIQKKKIDDDRPLTKKEHKLRLEEEGRLKRKQDRLDRGENIYAKTSSPTTNSSIDKDTKTLSDKNSLLKSKIHKNNSTSSKHLPKVPEKELSNLTKPVTNLKTPVEHSRKNGLHNTDRINSKVNKDRNVHGKSSERTEKKSNAKSAAVPSQPVSMVMPTIDTGAIIADIERKVREKLEKEFESKLLEQFKLNSAALQSNSSTKNSIVEKSIKKNVPSEISKSTLNGKPPMRVECKTVLPKRPLQVLERSSQKNLGPKSVEKKPFFKNPYMEPPRRLLESQRPHKPPPKRRYESDEDDDDEDDMSDFIEDGPSQNDEDYSKYIKEIFGYDRKKYRDQDEEDIRETSYAEQMKEEIKSAREGYLEDLEEEKLERERLKRKKMKKK